MARDMLFLRKLEWFNIRIVAGIALLSLLLFAGSAGAAPSEQWIRTFGNAGGEIAHSVQQTKDGGYILAGETQSYGNGSVDAWLIKTDLNGKEEWNRTFGGREQDYAYSVQQTKDGGYIIAGQTISYGARNYDAWLVKTDANGNEQWNRTFGRDGLLDAARSIELTSDGGYIIAGYTRSFGAGDEDIWLIKTDADGKEEWNRTFGGIKPDEGYSVQQTVEGGYIIAGMTRSFGNGAYLIKTDASGTEDWNRTFEIKGDEIAYSVRQTKDGGYIIAGDEGRFLSDESDAWLIKTDSKGIRQWDRTFGDKSGDAVYSVQQTADEGYVLGGVTGSFGAGDGDAWVIKTDPEGSEEWNITIGGKNHDEARIVRQIEGGDYIVAGEYSPGGTSEDAMIARISGKIPAPVITVTQEPIPAKQTAEPISRAKWTPPSEEWNRTFGGTGDYYARSVQQTSDGGYILSGYTGAFGAGDHAWLRKTDIDGLEIWNKTFTREAINFISSVQQIQDGYILTGYTGPDASYSSAWLIKTESNGNERWNRTYGENTYSWAYSVQQTSDGGYILAGRMRPQRDSWSEADFDAYLIKTDGNGNEQWNRTLGGKFRDEARSVSKTRDGGYILAGMSNSYGSYLGYAWLIRTDKDGNEKWNRTYSKSSSIYSDASSVHETSDGGYILAGVIGPVNGSGKEAWLIKTDENGNGQWNKTFGGKGNDGSSSVQQTADGGYILAGSPTDAGAQTAWLVKTDAKGNEQWNLTFEGKFNAYSAAQTADGGYIMAGDTFLPGADDRVAWLIKVSPVNKVAGFDAVLAITVFLSLYKIGKRRHRLRLRQP